MRTAGKRPGTEHDATTGSAMSPVVNHRPLASSMHAATHWKDTSRSSKRATLHPRVRGDERTVEGADARAQHEVGTQAGLRERPHHAHLARSEDAAAAEDVRGELLTRHTVNVCRIHRPAAGHRKAPRCLTGSLGAMGGAAIFDLDRTLLQGGTGPLLSRAMYDLGVVTRRLPGERLLYGLFDRVGETLPSILLARQATLVAKGREMASFDAAAVAAAETIAAVIHPFAISLIEQHKAAGRPVVLATTTPYHLIAPLAERLGFDHVVATRYRITDGRFDGALSGRFVWSRGKLAAVREWAESEGVDLSESFAYSDSIYDLPLLSAVGRPAAVNPDPRLSLYALTRGWPIVHFDVSPGVFKVPVVGVELQRLLFLASPPLLTPYARFDIAGTEQ